MHSTKNILSPVELFISVAFFASNCVVAVELTPDEAAALQQIRDGLTTGKTDSELSADLQKLTPNAYNELAATIGLADAIRIRPLMFNDPRVGSDGPYYLTAEATAATHDAQVAAAVNRISLQVARHWLNNELRENANELNKHIAGFPAPGKILDPSAVPTIWNPRVDAALAQMVDDEQKQRFVMGFIREIQRARSNYPSLSAAGKPILNAGTIDAALQIRNSFDTSIRSVLGRPDRESSWQTRYPELRPGGTHASYLPDLMRISELMRDPDRTVALLDPLSRGLTESASSMVLDNTALTDAITAVLPDGTLTAGTDPGDVIDAQFRADLALVTAEDDELKQLLRLREERHGFATARVVPLGVLPSDVFLELPTHGYMLNDIGPGANHGEDTHRLQWFAIMEDFERDPSQWNHTPLEVFIMLGEAEAIPRTGEAQLGSQQTIPIWARLFDMNGGGFDPNTQSIGLPGFTQPDAMMNHLEKIAIGPAAANSRALAFHVSQRFAARKRMRDALNSALPPDEFDAAGIRIQFLDRGDRKAIALTGAYLQATGRYEAFNGDPNSVLIHVDDPKVATAEMPARKAAARRRLLTSSGDDSSVSDSTADSKSVAGKTLASKSSTKKKPPPAGGSSASKSNGKKKKRKGK